MANERRLIDADELQAKFERNMQLFLANGGKFSDLPLEYKARADELLNCAVEVANAPAVDAVEIVRCAECEYLEMDGKAPFTHLICMRHEFVFRVKPDGFCSRGKRRDETNG